MRSASAAFAGTASAARAKTCALPLLWRLNGAIRSLATFTHAVQSAVDWGLPPVPAWSDHYTDVYWQWGSRGTSFFLERGVLNAIVIRDGGHVLDLCCGDGFFARRFFAERAGRVTAFDGSSGAIAFARRYNARPNISILWATEVRSTAWAI